MAKAKHGTLTANTVATVTLDTPFRYTAIVDVINRSMTGEIYVTTDGTDPTVAGDDTILVAGVTSFARPNGASLTVKLISSAALSYTVQERPA
jgi:hypothetical protein